MIVRPAGRARPDASRPRPQAGASPPTPRPQRPAVVDARADVADPAELQRLEDHAALTVRQPKRRLTVELEHVGTGLMRTGLRPQAGLPSPRPVRTAIRHVPGFCRRHGIEAD